jgi:hypothetical protein
MHGQSLVLSVEKKHIEEDMSEFMGPKHGPLFNIN